MFDFLKVNRDVKALKAASVLREFGKVKLTWSVSVTANFKGSVKLFPSSNYAPPKKRKIYYLLYFL